jgi:hypothetical protein
MAIAIIGTMSFPLLTGLYYDVFENYRSAWFIMAVILCGGVPAALKAHPPGSHRKMT